MKNNKKNRNYLMLKENSMLTNFRRDVNCLLLKKYGFTIKLNLLNEFIFMYTISLLRLHIFLIYFKNFIEENQLIGMVDKKYIYIKVIDLVNYKIYLFKIMSIVLNIIIYFNFFLKSLLYKLIMILKNLNKVIKKI